MKGYLVARPIYIPGESPAGLLMRAVDGNGYPSLQALIGAYFGVNSVNTWAKASYVDPSRFDQIVDALGIKDASGMSPAFSRSGPTSESDRLLDGMIIPEKLFRDDGRYYCPECLKERKFWRKLWTLKPYSVCPKHGKLLLRDCSVCSEELVPWRGKLVTCRCGADLRDAQSEPADPAPVQWWLDCHNGAGPDPKMVDASLQAMTAADESGDSPSAEHRRLMAARDWIMEGQAPAYLADLAQQRSESLHPRIQLLPMLCSNHAEVRGLAQALLQCWKHRAPERLPGSRRGLQTREAELALGVSCFQLKKFKRMGLVGPPVGGKGVRGHVSLDSVNRILYAMQASRQGEQNVARRPQTVSTATLVKNVLSGVRQSAGYDIEHGLATLRLVAESHDDADRGIGDEWLDVSQIAAYLNTYPDAIRFVERKGWLPARHRDLQNRKRLIAYRADVEAFDRQYVFAGVLAKALKVNPTNLAEKLMELGVQPVSGPSVDGALVYLFRREEVARVDVNRLLSLKTYKTRAGRPKDAIRLAHQSRDGAVISAVDAARMLGIGVQHLALLAKMRILVKADTHERAVHFDRKSVDELLHTLQRKDLISVEDAAVRLGQEKGTFERLWIKRKALKVHDLGLWRLVSVRALNKLAKAIEGKVTAAEAGRIKSMHRSHFPNMERRGKAKSVKIGGKGGVRLYDRTGLDMRES